MPKPVPIEVAPPTPMPIPSSVSPPSGPRPSPAQRYLEEKKHLLTLINGERKKAGLAPVILGNNAAAQQHAEALLRHNISGHWGVDGLLPQMRYTLAGGVNYVSENVSTYRLRPGMPYRKQGPEALLRRSHQGLMTSPGHRKNILDKWHKKVSLGIDCNDYACSLLHPGLPGPNQQFPAHPVQLADMAPPEAAQERPRACPREGGGWRAL